MNHTDSFPANSPKSTNPTAIEAMQAGRSSLGFHLSWTAPAMIGMNSPKDWCGNRTIVTQKGSSPFPSSIISGTKREYGEHGQVECYVGDQGHREILVAEVAEVHEGVLHPPLDDDEQSKQREEQQVHGHMV